MLQYLPFLFYLLPFVAAIILVIVAWSAMASLERIADAFARIADTASEWFDLQRRPPEPESPSTPPPLMKPARKRKRSDSADSP